MQRQRLAVATGNFSQPLKASLVTASQMKAQGVQLDARSEVSPTSFSDTGKREFLNLLKELNLSVASLSFPTRRNFYDQDQLEARVTATKAAMQLARNLQSGILTIRIGTLPEDLESLEAILLRDVLNDLARHGNHVGATISITPSRDSPQKMKTFLSSITEGPLGIDFDPATFVMGGTSPVSALRELHNYVCHYRIRDGIKDMDGIGKEVPVGRGEVDWNEFLPLIDETAYQGWLTIDRTQGEDKITDSANTIQFLKQTMML